jgi:Na+:H+ antiporter, NhaA family
MFRTVIRKPRSAMRAFLQSESAGGILLITAAALALIIANSQMATPYLAMRDHIIGPVLTEKLGPMTIMLWVNDGLMALFFLLVGLEIKREFLDGHLANRTERRLPFIAAAGGMIMPALIYLALTVSEPHLARGWAIPAATDLAFALGLIALLGRRVPTALKLFLTTVAIVDDIGAVIIIALFYTAKLNIVALGSSALILGIMVGANRSGLRHPGWYIAGFLMLWYTVLLSGVHATVAGVLAAFTVPIIITPAAPDALGSTLHRFEHALHPWVAFLIVPLFGFFNAGVDITNFDAVIAPLPLAILLGLFLGKQCGVFGSIWLAVRFGLATRPGGSNWLQLYGVALLSGIGFTMSLFIGGLAFTAPPESEAVKLGVIAGSMLSATAGFLVLRFARAPR